MALPLFLYQQQRLALQNTTHGAALQSQRARTKAIKAPRKVEFSPQLINRSLRVKCASRYHEGQLWHGGDDIC